MQVVAVLSFLGKLLHELFTTECSPTFAEKPSLPLQSDGKQEQFRGENLFGQTSRHIFSQLHPNLPRATSYQCIQAVDFDI